MAPQRVGSGRQAGWPFPSKAGSCAPEDSFLASPTSERCLETCRIPEKWQRDSKNLGWKYEVQTTRGFSR